MFLLSVLTAYCLSDSHTYHLALLHLTFDQYYQKPDLAAIEMTAKLSLF